MILWRDGGHGAIENMRRDACLLARLDAASAPAEAILRVYTFDPPGITLGRAQRPGACLDVARCAADGIEWAVRPTGGRAIHHDGTSEWTYAFAARIDDPAWGGSLRETYARVSALVAASLRDLGVPAALVDPVRRADDGGWAARPSCFAATLAHEIELDGRKLVGSAQRRTAVAWLQQGSVLLGDAHLELADRLAGDAAARERARDALARNTLAAGPWLGGDMRLDRWADALARRLGDGLRVVTGPEGEALPDAPMAEPAGARAS
jgi:lipoyl(octanoyl) transferase